MENTRFMRLNYSDRCFLITWGPCSNAQSTPLSLGCNPRVDFSGKLSVVLGAQAACTLALLELRVEFVPESTCVGSLIFSVAVLAIVGSLKR